MSEDFGVPTAVALGVGGIVGGGIYAAIGIVVMAAGMLTWFSYALATVVVLCCAYSYVTVNDLTEHGGGAVTFIEELSGRSTAAGVVGWTLVVGYVGTMAMYAYAFGAYGQMLLGVEYLWGLSVRPMLSVGVVALFVGVNLLGASASGATERYLVIVQAGIIAAFGVLGLAFGLANGEIHLGLSEFGVNPVIAASVGFVSFEGWQLLFYDQDQFEDPQSTLKRGVFVSIPIAASIYVLVGLVITSILPVEVVMAQPEAALLYGALRIGPWLALAVGIAGLVSTASAINSTMFSEVIFARGLIEDDILPSAMGEDIDESDGDQDGDESDGGQDAEECTLPRRTVLVIGALTAAFTTFGSLEAVVEFASLSFIVVFGAVCALAIVHHEGGRLALVPPVIGFVGSVAFFAMLLWYLYARLPAVFSLVIAIAVVVFAVEALYFKRDAITTEARAIEEEI